uniref:Uncharacterized protein n=1 Tax=Timema douglasi TaxID=61478 RepID=A0A7R8VG78_TIMDO|nr:unnamed protein product [Timema douglasi]
MGDHRPPAHHYIYKVKVYGGKRDARRGKEGEARERDVEMGRATLGFDARWHLSNAPSVYWVVVWSELVGSSAVCCSSSWKFADQMFETCTSYCYRKEALENRLGQHEVVRKSNRSPSLRLRFGRRADPSIAVLYCDSDAIDHVATEAGWGNVSNDYNNNVIVRGVFSPVFSRSSVVERLGFYSQLSLQRCVP